MRKRTTKPPEVVGPPVSTEQRNVYDITVRLEMFGKPDRVEEELRSVVDKALNPRLPSVEIRSVRSVPTAELDA